MKLMHRISFFYFLLYCLTQTLGLTIQSVPSVNSDDVIQVELKETVSLVCGLDGGSDAVANDELVWLRNGATVVLKEGNTNGRSAVCISPVVVEDNEAVFTCFLSKNDSLRKSVTLNVTYPPQLSGSQEVTVEEKEQLVLQCDIWANPPVSSVTWTLNGSMVDLSASGFTVTSDGHTSQLRAGDVKRSLHEGTYQCSADGKYSKLFHVTVTDWTMKFPLYPMVAALVVVCLTAIFAIVSRWETITKCCK